MKEVIFLVNKYPNKLEPNACIFIQQLIYEMSNLGVKCKVINPLPVNLNYRYLFFKNKMYDEHNKNIEIYYPKYISFGQAGYFLQKTRVFFTTMFYKYSCEKIVRNEIKDNDKLVIYGHFLCPSGMVAAQLGKKYKLRSIIAHGDSTYSGDEKYGNKNVRNELKNVSGVIAVSTDTKNTLIKENIIDKNKISVFPNGYNPKRFYKIDKIEARKFFGWDENIFIIGFCGSFIERKGPLRLEEAVNKIDDVYLAYCGKGPQMPTSNKCIFKKPINNDNLIYFYNAIDVFVLPTLNEGCCNAIIEAMACGCPIVSSDLDFNYDILDDTNAILVNPNNITDIRNAIVKIKENKQLRNKLQNGSLNKSKELILENRARNIINFIFK